MHDRYGCAAFLGAFTATATEHRYCACKEPREAEIRPARLGEIVATVTLRERNGSAIAVCESPPALELGASSEAVLSSIKRKLIDSVGTGDRAATRRLRVIRRQRGRAVETIEPLR
ncbi:MAG TPA: hypothetical protein VK665_17610 [Candidatus Elarobacter sp.]|nr:hypothetical protein [Candidatus Elarobacter sp.]